MPRASHQIRHIFAQAFCGKSEVITTHAVGFLVRALVCSACIMPELSQKTLAHVMQVLDSLLPEDADAFPLLRKYWETILFEWGFPDWFIKYAGGSSYNWTKVIRDLYTGSASAIAAHHAPGVLQESMLIRLTAMAMTASKQTPAKEQLRRSLQLDGFEVNDGKVQSIQGPVSITEEQNIVLTNLAGSSFAQRDIIKKHLQDAEDHFSAGKMHSVIGESRSAFQAAVEDAVSQVEGKVGRKSGGGLKNQIEFLTRQGFISSDEESAFLAAWGFLCAGAHPGLPADEAGRIGSSSDWNSYKCWCSSSRTLFEQLWPLMN